jgi:peptide-methionine (S)-S-oxide reductase
MKFKKMTSLLILPMVFVFGTTECNTPNDNSNNKKMENNSTISAPTDSVHYDTATFGAGCFWCVEAVFAELKGVKATLSGYTGGTVVNPTYEQICTGNTGHAEVAQIIYDPKLTSYKDLLEVFWQVHDPTSLNRQGPDIGSQYRSVVFYRTEEQKREAEYFKKRLNEDNVYGKPVVTTIEPMGHFYKAEDYHQDYNTNNANQPYCVYVIKPKLDKFRKVFKEKLK